MPDKKLDLSVPQLTERYASDPTVVEGLIRQVETIPLDDIPSALNLAHKKLRAINRGDLNATQLALVAQAYDKIYARIAGYFQAIQGGDKFAREIEVHELDELGLFTQELSFVYKHILKGFSPLSKHDREKALFSYMAMYYLGQFMLQSYDRYTWFSPVLWRELHILYLYSEQEGYLGQQKPDPANSQNTQSVGELYAQICTLALTDPYHLRPGENWTVCNYLRTWADHIEVLPPLANMHPQNAFRIDLDSGSRPLLALEYSIEKSGDQRWLSLNKLIELMELHKDQLQGKTKASAIGLGEYSSNEAGLRLLDTLLSRWTSDFDRKEERHAREEEIQIIWGLSDIYTYLSPQVRRDDLLQKKPLDKIRVTHGNSMNVSRNGMCFVAHDKSSELANVGELVLLLRSGANGVQTRLGYVCWSTKTSDGVIRLGMQLVSGTPKAVNIQSQNSDMHDRKSILIVTARAYGNSVASLLAPPDVLEIDDKMTINVPGSDETHEAQVSTLLDRTGYFDQFKFEPISKPRQH